MIHHRQESVEFVQENISSSLESETNFWRIFGNDEREKSLFSIVWIKQVVKEASNLGDGTLYELGLDKF